MRYLLDSDALISAKALYYRPSYCRGFWDWLEDCRAADAICSIDKVRDELLAGDEDDHLVQWAKEKNSDGFFLSTRGAMTTYAAVANWAQSQKPPFKQGGLARFLRADAADAWLVAFAMKHPGQYTIVTNEIGAPERRSDIKIPDAAQAMGVPTMKLFELLELLAHGTFNFRAP